MLVFAFLVILRFPHGHISPRGVNLVETCFDGRNGHGVMHVVRRLVQNTLLALAFAADGQP